MSTDPIKKAGTVWRWCWLGLALIITALSFRGGDTAILAGWMFLAWTVPFGVIWWFFIASKFPYLADGQLLQVLGQLLSICVAYGFWFKFVPWVNAAVRDRRNRSAKNRF